MELDRKGYKSMQISYPVPTKEHKAFMKKISRDLHSYIINIIGGCSCWEFQPICDCHIGVQEILWFNQYQKFHGITHPEDR